MAFNELDRKRIANTVGALCKRWSSVRSPAQPNLGYSIRDQEVLIHERQRGADDARAPAAGIAKLRYVRKSHVWKLYWQRASGRWVSYQPLPESRELKRLVQEVESDPYGAFFG